MSETVYTDPALTASKEPFNRAYIILTQAQNSNLQNMVDKLPKYIGTPGIFGGSINPGRVPSLAAVFSQTAGFMLAYKAIGKINAVSEAIDQEAKMLKCNTEYNYELYFTPNGFAGMAPKGKASILPTGSEIKPQTIVGTNCPNRVLSYPKIILDKTQEDEIKSKFEQYKKGLKK